MASRWTNFADANSPTGENTFQDRRLKSECVSIKAEFVPDGLEQVLDFVCMDKHSLFQNHGHPKHDNFNPEHVD